MVAPPIPPNEPERLAALRAYQILDTPPERAFERISQLAARIFEVPISLVSLVDADRQWLKSCFGADLRQTDRRISFCAYTILQDSALVVEDAASDSRFKDNPLVTGAPGIRFYAGAPLTTAEGHRLGSLCVIDTAPRTFPPESYGMLKDVAEIVVDELELRRASRQLREEIAVRVEAEKRLAELAARDPLTRLHNRSVPNERLEGAIAAAKNDRPAALLYIDLDTFKIVNDTLGHGAGDRLLVKVADLLRSCTRPEDTVTRFGGDEFAVVLCGVARDAAMEIAERMRKQFQKLTFAEAGRSFTVGASVGVALIDGTLDREHLLANADAACYAAKARGCGRVELYQDNPEELQRLRTDSDVVAKVNAASRDRRLLLHFQPVVNLQTGETEFHEALLRLQTETGALLPPNEFLPAATRFGLIEQIDREVVRLAAATMKARPGQRLFINLSAKAFNNRALLEEIRTAFSEAGVSPDRVIFEITETEIIRNLTLARELIGDLQASGFRFALDDFGSGVSNLAYLKRLPLDFIKIDGGFVRDILTDRTYRGFVKAINEIAAYLKVKTLAEYVESEAIVQALKEIGIQYGQGFHLGQPKPFE